MLKDFIIPSKTNNYNPLFSTRVAIVFLTLWILLVNSFSGILMENFGVYATTMSADRIIEFTNQERIQRGLQPVKSDALLTAAAYAKANNMFKEQYWNHFGPNGESPWQFIKASGYDYLYAGENLAKGFTTSEAVHQAWMASPTHKENIVGGDYVDIGIAIVSGSLNNENVILVVQMFGSLSQGVSDGSSMLGAPQEVKGDSGDDKTKSIRITYPEEGSVYNDSQIPIKGDVENFDVGSVVEIVADNNVLGQAKVQSNKAWEFQNDYDWKEGKNNIDAVVNFGLEKLRDSVSFLISSAPPKILGIETKKEENEFKVTVSVEESAVDLSLITGDKIIKGNLIDGVGNISVADEDIADKIFVVVTDVHGNFEQKDITSYFSEKEARGNLSLGGFVNFNVSSVQRGVTVLLAVVILAILLIQIYFYKKANQLNEKSGDFLMVGIWWLIFLFGSFIGYSGTIY